MIPVLGMHRSGTSALAGALHKIGADLGPESSWIPPAADNPLGFFEYAPIVSVNRKILAAFGGTWSSPPALPPGWVSEERVEDALEHARELAEEMPRDLVVKDPRLSLVMPLWDTITDPRPAVICLRHPVATARSLESRNAFPVDTGLFLWFRYVAAATLARPEALVIQYEHLLRDPATVLRRVADHIGHECSDATIELAAETVRGDFAHEDAAPLPPTPIGALCADTYDALRADGLGAHPDLLRWARLVTELPWAGPADREINIAGATARELAARLEATEAELAASQRRCERLAADLRELTLGLDRSSLAATEALLTGTQEAT
jgi:hypothetical protein